MLAANVPARFKIAFASSALPGDIRPIPDASQIGIQPGAASNTDGFPPVCFIPVGAGGVPPFGQDFNGLFNQITLWNQWQAAGGPVTWNAAFSTAIGGYPQGALVQSATVPGRFYVSTVDNNASNPDTGGAGWAAFTGPTRVVSASGSFTINAGDTKIGLNRTSAPATSSATLRTDAYDGQIVAIEDLANNFNKYPVTVSGPLPGGVPAVLNVNRQCGIFTYYKTPNLWSVKL